MDSTTQLLSSFDSMSLGSPHTMKVLETAARTEANENFNTDNIIRSLIVKLFVNRSKWPEFFATENMRHLTLPDVSAYITFYWEEPCVWFQFRVGYLHDAEIPTRIDFQKYINKTKTFVFANGKVMDLRSMFVKSHRFGGDFRLGVDVSFEEASELVDHFLTVPFMNRRKQK